ncbi:transporter substrate-binding domain-containing protein [Paraglaciecola hydrolytica]|uniref:Uncharacterized protein n=1 Tax=Paraglaciecola hydrolytica TaxID=1799789 RepID=A0A136A528_9ALTE|nr:transporter substrate-binding domain-containing protein [Paraglaciecola hydrolytica]KXI30327.1 hypothetical protein AX660_10140 [Paraglaciecola hydrolytica]
MKIITLVVIILLACNCHAKNKIVLAAEDSWPPFSRSDGEGISQQTILQAYQLVGVEVEFVVVPYARALHMAKMGEADGAFNVTKQQSTIAQFSFGEEPLLQAKASFYYPSTSHLDFTSINEAPDSLVIALILGYEYGESYEMNRSRFKEIRVSNQIQIINLMLKNRVDMAIMFDDVAEFYLSKMQVPTTILKKGQVNHISDIYVAFNNKPEIQPLIDKLDLGLRLMRSVEQP